ncbi:RNA 2',3'-cyclic phosphodiesterase [Desulfovirgula thermocuniculi]|uniref:RNA 2',3'-cyclic phosphodiesterase n=1 Tax=Desulfovirgula thermocuniculi TaxID=348842 RepID=UPI00048865E7|nr:RNA 2',3'-cyclic phosphodiesterase [Desulfovirgula thermocuniculi]
MRLFWAVNLPPEVKEAISALQESLKGSGADAKWVERENLHLTVQFLGEVEEERLGALVEAGGAALQGWRAFTVSLEGLGAFPDFRRPRVLWLGVREGVEALREIHRALSSAMAALGLGGEERAYVPHLTLARFRSARGLEAFTGKVKGLLSSPPAFGPLTVTSVDLMESRLTPRGPLYTLKAKIHLESASKKGCAGDKV